MSFLKSPTAYAIGVTLLMFVGAFAIVHFARRHEPPATQVTQGETLMFDPYLVRVYRDDAHNATCYILNNTISCVRDPRNR